MHSKEVPFFAPGNSNCLVPHNVTEKKVMFGYFLLHYIWHPTMENSLFWLMLGESKVGDFNKIKWGKKNSIVVANYVQLYEELATHHMHPVYLKKFQVK